MNTSMQLLLTVMLLVTIVQSAKVVKIFDCKGRMEENVPVEHRACGTSSGDGKPYEPAAKKNCNPGDDAMCCHLPASQVQGTGQLCVKA
ncbi:hypothetical protein Pst134EA_025457 [Puccinia striiformis f. sp. tritici]|uniref:hypothetical protein n=1 Tax=Puccinia striiformis f. sp. tritici TaxID=168172 RepID=UPI002007D981|nr:hypothetical protein Pst134EA_025457 [Puccinia striiformis f. sp. tritici]KAH9451504.1 hypothetical protein Pst134EA_025457 [Puccinia striiformis f. sp. tritici]